MLIGDFRQSFLSRYSYIHDKALILEIKLKNIADIILVVHHQNSVFGHVNPWVF